MKILMVNDYKTVIGGAEVYMYTLKEQLEKQGHQVEVFGTGYTLGEYIHRLSHISITDYLNRIWNGKVKAEFAKQVQSFKPDVVHIHSFYNELSPSFLAAIPQHVKVLLTIHDQRLRSAFPDPDCSYAKTHRGICPGCAECVGVKGIVIEQIKQRVYTKMLQRVDLFLCPSRFILHQMEHFTELKPIAHLPNGFTRSEYQKLPDTKTVLYAGRLVQEKGVQVLLEALPQVLKQFQDVQLHIVGDGAFESNLKDLAEKTNITKNLTFHGSIPHKQVQKYLYNSAVVCIPSIYKDNLPTIGIEALSAGRILVASKIGGLPELVEHNKTGILVAAGKSNALAEALIEIFSSKDKMNEMSKAAREKSEEFAIERHVMQILKYYQT